MAVSPKRTPVGVTVNCSSLSLMSGGRIGMPQIAALAQVQRELVGILRFDRQQRGHEMPWIVGLQVRRLIGQLGIRRRVRLVEAVPGEVLHQLEDPLRLLLGDAVLRRALDELFALLGLIAAAFFFPIALRSTSDWPSEKPASTLAIRMTCSW